MKRIRFAWLVLAAWVRGLFYRWPSQPTVPAGYTACSCGLRSLRECWEMYHYHGWEPWGFQRTKLYGWSRVFRIAKSAEDLAFEEAMAESYRVAAMRHLEEEGGVS